MPHKPLINDMDPETTKLLIQNLPQILIAIAAVVTAIGTIVNYKRTGEAIDQGKKTAESLGEVHESVNGTLAKLLELTRLR